MGQSTGLGMLDDDSALYQYLRDHLRGASAKCIAAHLVGWGETDGSYPSDAGDFGRCEALLDAAPEFRARLGEMVSVNAYWAALVVEWERLRGLGSGSMDVAIRDIIAPIEQLDPGATRVGGCVLRHRAITFSQEDYLMARAARGKKAPMKEEPADKAVAADAYRVTADELRAFVDRYEGLEAEKAEIADQMKGVMGEAKALGYHTKALRKLIALRKRKPDEVAEEEAVLDLYKAALGME